MEEAARIANALNFINGEEKIGGHDHDSHKETIKAEDDGQGFERSVGLKGSKLSGGQKQRVAIARTVIRRPLVYMFDESTSALDTQSEKVVQGALSKVSQDLTTMSIAHRVSTIKNSDVIFVIEGGKVVEEGTYDKLIEKKGAFFELNKNR